MHRSLRFASLAAVLISAASLLTLAASAQTMGSPERYTGSAININNGRADNIDITVNRWSTDKQRDALMSVVANKGVDKLLDALQDMPVVGHFGVPGNLSWDIHFARKLPLPEGGQRVVLVTDRRIGFWEAANQPRSIDYPFTVIELRLNREGQGEGTMSLATRVIYDKDQNMITLENLQNQPIRLTNLRREAASH
jgi:hypothetical protein